MKRKPNKYGYIAYTNRNAPHLKKADYGASFGKTPEEAINNYYGHCVLLPHSSKEKAWLKKWTKVVPANRAPKWAIDFVIHCLGDCKEAWLLLLKI